MPYATIGVGIYFVCVGVCVCVVFFFSQAMLLVLSYVTCNLVGRSVLAYGRDGTYRHVSAAFALTPAGGIYMMVLYTISLVAE